MFNAYKMSSGKSILFVHNYQPQNIKKNLRSWEIENLRDSHFPLFSSSQPHLVLSLTMDMISMIPNAATQRIGNQSPHVV